MPNELNGMIVAFLVANEGVEQVELTEPWRAVEQAGGRPVLVAPEPKPVRAMNHLTYADEFEPEKTTLGLRVDDYDAVVLPGGVANPDALRQDISAVNFLREFVQAGKPVAAICHAGWMLVEADVVRGRHLTSWPSLRTDICNAGGNWGDLEVVVDGNLVTSRKPADLPAFCAALVEVFGAAGPATGTRTIDLTEQRAGAAQTSSA